MPLGMGWVVARYTCKKYEIVHYLWTELNLRTTRSRGSSLLHGNRASRSHPHQVIVTPLGSRGGGGGSGVPAFLRVLNFTVVRPQRQEHSPRRLLHFPWCCCWFHYGLINILRLAYLSAPLHREFIRLAQGLQATGPGHGQVCRQCFGNL